MIVKHFFEGGPYLMLLIYIMWIVVLFFAAKLLINYFSDKRNLVKLEKYNSIILFSGSFAFLFGIFGQIIGFFQILDVIHREGDIAFSLIAGGLRVTLITVIYGFALLLVSAIIWFVNRNLLKK
ncbi:MAG: MotA/TolQ/ExbB proton channel family protein [Bacteroidales bacterium]|jgi:biopolymer transport protein ExbB/TolQ|nr:MotA/TolQ/ExbB proton channel family protein [Bacteroidales bacterium]